MFQLYKERKTYWERERKKNINKNIQLHISTYNHKHTHTNILRNIMKQQKENLITTTT